MPVFVNDGTDNSNTFNLTVSVIPSSDIPLITGQLLLSTPEETALTIILDDLLVSDVDNVYPDDFTLIVGDGNNYDRSGATITPNENYNGNL